ncbi:hypothetical protein IFT62_25170 [Pseudomonas lutea]|uniref:Permease n=2 Tax=Pseudomonas lutea TaxID=243924 RepID=A0ABR9AED4_9PSED|nr:hypothetical protein [Pseudomonas lutea]
MMRNFEQLSERLRWFLGDMSEPTFYKQEIASLGMLLGGLLSHWAWKRGKKWQGFSVSYGTGLLPWIMFSSFLSLVLSNLIWGWTILESHSWQPTFVAFISVPAATVLMHGSGWKISVVGAILGALVVTPLALILVNYMCLPYGLPTVIGNVLAIVLGSILSFMLFRIFPLLVENHKGGSDSVRPKAIHFETYGPAWVVRRMLADFTESPFISNELAGAGLIIGMLIAISLNPLSPAYGSGLTTQILTGQMIASALSVLIWRRAWMVNDWYPTYVPVVSVTPASIVLYGGAPVSIILSATLGALIAPPLAAFITGFLPKDFHPYIGSVLSMYVCCVTILPLIGFFV